MSLIYYLPKLKYVKINICQQVINHQALSFSDGYGVCFTQRKWCVGSSQNNHKPNVRLKENQSGTNGSQHRVCPL